MDIKLTENELKIKVFDSKMIPFPFLKMIILFQIQELQKTFSDNVLNSYLEQYKEECKIFENRYEQVWFIYLFK